MPAGGGYAAPAPAKSGSVLPWLIGGCGCLLVIGILVAIAAAGFWYVGQHPEILQVNSSSSPAPASEPGAATPSTAGVTKVELSWNERVDMDLEVWNASGQNLLKRSFNLCGEDVKDGTTGREWFEFKRFSAEDDFSSGIYIVSLYFAARPDGSTVEQASATLTITKPDGSVETRRKTINWEPGRDQWHAFSIDAATGAITDKDEFVRIQNNN